jgi:hypothetical protein
MLCCPDNAISVQNKHGQRALYSESGLLNKLTEKKKHDHVKRKCFQKLCTHTDGKPVYMHIFFLMLQSAQPNYRLNKPEFLSLSNL